MYKNRLVLGVLIFAMISSFPMQIHLFTSTVTLNTIGIVYGANGPLSGAYVYADSAEAGGNGSSFAITDELGHYNMTTGLTTGRYNVTAFAYGYITEEIGFVNVTQGQTMSGINFDLQASGGISGIITDAVSGDPLNGTTIYANLSNGTGSFGWFGTTGADGSYLIATNLVTGTYNVSILLPPEGHISKSANASVVAGIETKNVNLQLARSGIISGKVAAPNGTSLFGIDVTAMSNGGMTYFGFSKTDLSGNYRIATGLGTGNYSVYANGAGNFTAYGGIMSPTPVPVTAGEETANIDMELTPVTTPPIPSGTVSGRIIDQSNNPIRYASVSATGTNGTGFAQTDENGYYNISSGLQDGNDYNVSATASGYYDAYYPTLVTVTVGQTTADINIQMTAKPAETFGTITGTVTGTPNPIIPEFQFPVVEILMLAVASIIVVKFTRERHARLIK